MAQSIRPGDVLAGRYRLVDLLSESGGGRFWRAHDRVLERHVALHVISETDERADGLIEAARRSATVPDRRTLRVLDAERVGGLCYVVNEWGIGTSLDVLVATEGPLPPRRAAWLVAEVADSVARAHEAGVAHGRLVPENVMIDSSGAVRVIGLAVDAALHGLSADRRDDLVDLVALLYCALTGRWAGRSASGVPAAPRDHGRVLRPRQVRAGVPRPLDSLCDQLLNPPLPVRGTDQGVPDSAREIADLLAGFVGDPTGMAEQLAVVNGHRAPETVVLPPVPEIPAREEPGPRPAPGPASSGNDGNDEDDEATLDPAPGPAAGRGPRPDDDLATQPGMPAFDDDPDDAWYSPSGESAPPPPPFEEPPARPLFAPTPPEGTPARRPRHDSPAPRAADEYWPWTDTGRGTGTGLPAVPRSDTDDEVPGRSWLRLAAAIGAALLLLVAVVVAINLGRGKTPLGSDPDDSPSPSTTRAALRPVTGLAATDFDPQGGADGENPETVGQIVDGDPETTWRTMTYRQQFGPGGLKNGVGAVIDLGSVVDVARVDLRMVGGPTGVALYLTDTAPGDVADLEPAATRTVDGSARIAFRDPVRGRYLTLWLTSLPQASDGFRGEVAEVTVLR